MQAGLVQPKKKFIMFESSRVKIKRANKHISDFNELVKAFVQTDFCSFNIQKDLNTGQNVLQFNMTREAPVDLALILGDSIHNLRSALDHAYVELLTLIGKKSTKWSLFKIYENRDELVNTLSHGILKGEDDIVSMLADNIGAHKGGDALLCALHFLDISDKHMLLIPVFGIAHLNHVDADIVMGKTTITMRDCTFGVGQGGILNLIETPATSEMSIKSKGQPSFGMFFGKGTGLEGQLIGPTLTKFTQLVGHILEIFEREVASRNV